MTDWIHQPGNMRRFDKLCRERTPITIVSAVDPSCSVDCIPVWLTGDAFCIAIDEDDNQAGFKRGDKAIEEVEMIGDVIIREKQPAAQSA